MNIKLNKLNVIIGKIVKITVVNKYIFQNMNNI